MKRNGHHVVLERSHDVARVLAGHGLGILAERSGLRRFRMLRRGIPSSAPLTQAERLRMALGELGPTFIKLGQVLSTRADLIPPEFVSELAKLQDGAPPIPVAEVVRVIEEDLGAPVLQRFATFEPIPIAAASIGQVHAATLLDGREAVIKVRRPGVVEEVERDLEVLARLAAWMQTHDESGRADGLPPLVDEFAFTIRNELDYVREGQSADRLRRLFADDPGVRIPCVHWETTTQRVLTLERVAGIKITDVAAIDRAGISRRAVAENAMRLVLREVLEFGFFHADPHPGNFFVQPDGSIALVDFGMVGRVSDALQVHLLRAGLAAMEQDAESLAEELYAMGIAGRRANVAAFRRDLDHLVGRYGGLSLAELSATAVSQDLLGIAFRHRLQLPSDLALLMRVVSMSEGIGLSLDPEFHYLETAAPYFRRRWSQHRSPAALAGRLARSAGEAAVLGSELPRRMDRLMGRLERGELQLGVVHENLDRVTRQFQHMTNRLVLALILAASVMALSVALGSHGVSGIEPLIRVLFGLGFVFSLAFGVWLLVSMWRSRDR